MLPVGDIRRIVVFDFKGKTMSNREVLQQFWEVGRSYDMKVLGKSVDRVELIGTGRNYLYMHSRKYGFISLSRFAVAKLQFSIPALGVPRSFHAAYWYTYKGEGYMRGAAKRKKDLLEWRRKDGE